MLVQAAELPANCSAYARLNLPGVNLPGEHKLPADIMVGAEELPGIVYLPG